MCDFPPLRVQFTAPPPATSLFAGQKKLKLVTHCRNSAVVPAICAARIFRLPDVQCAHPAQLPRAARQHRLSRRDGRPIISRVGYFLEDLGDLAKRNGMKPTHAPERIPTTDLSPPMPRAMRLFQHMIANHDWSMRAGPAGRDCCHNAELIGPLASGATIPVPYDFDFSGYVERALRDAAGTASHPVRSASGSIAAIAPTMRRVVAAARQMRDARPQMIAAITATPGLEPRTQARAIEFLDGFFADIAIGQCR